MKKTLLIALALITKISFSQSLNLYVTTSTGVNTATITNGSTYNETTTTGTTTSTRFKLRNTSANTRTYTVVRTVTHNVPALALDGLGNSPDTYFAFGSNLFASNINTPTSADYIILGPAGSSTVPFDNSYDNSQIFLSYVDEGSTQGKYIVRYGLYNVNNSTDSLAFFMNYNNALLGVGEFSSVKSELSVYPNPSKGDITVKLPFEMKDGSVTVKNVLGEEVDTYSTSVHGKDLKMNCGALPAGLYFLSATNGSDRFSGKFILAN